MKGKIIILLVLTTFMFSYGISQKPQEQVAIELDNGQKWKVDENMMVFIQNMESDVSGFKGKTLAEYLTLSEGLQENINLLTSNCTMKGKAHDELHKWLVPHIGLVNDFSETETEQAASDSFQQLETSFITFNTYFK